MIKTINKDVCQLIRREMEAALKPVAEQFGVQIKYLGGRFNDSNFETRFEVAVKDSDGRAVTRMALHFKQCAVLYGFAPEDLGRKFRHAGVPFEIIGLNPDAPKYPIIAKRVRDGKQYRFTPDVVKAFLI